MTQYHIRTSSSPETLVASFCNVLKVSVVIIQSFLMRHIFLYFLTFILFLGCKKKHTSRVDIYMLQSFSININQTTSPATHTISNAVFADTPLITDQDIEFYTKSTTTFKLRKDIQPIIMNYGADKAFAVTVDKQPVYLESFILRILAL